MDRSLWIGDGNKDADCHPITSHTALQSIKLVGDKLRIISSYKMDVWDIAVTPTNDILLATSEPGLKQIEARSNKVTDSVYCEDINNLSSVHVTKDGKVVVGGQK